MGAKGAWVGVDEMQDDEVDDMAWSVRYSGVGGWGVRMECMTAGCDDADAAVLTCACVFVGVHAGVCVGCVAQTCMCTRLMICTCMCGYAVYGVYGRGCVGCMCVGACVCVCVDMRCICVCVCMCVCVVCNGLGAAGCRHDGLTAAGWHDCGRSCNPFLGSVIHGNPNHGT